MINRYLGDYHNFLCIADKCPATCCSGWLIEIDDEYLEKYRNDEGPLKQDFLERIDWKEHCFKQQDNGDCAFLRPDGLCHMQANLGEKILCKTCSSFPRHTEEFPGIREHSLSMSCPAVAKAAIDSILSGGTYNLTWSKDVETSEKDTASYDDFNNELYNLLFASRAVAYKILEKKNLSFNEKADLIGLMMDEIQNLYDTEETEKVDYVFDYFLSDAATDAIAEVLTEDKNGFIAEGYKEYFKNLFELEPLKDEFRQFEESAYTKLFLELSAEELVNSIDDFKAAYPQIEVLQTTLANYFLSTYMCGAVYDEYIYSQTEQAFFHAKMIMLLWLYQWLKNGSQLTNEEFTSILYGYCREIENSNENLIELEKLLD